MRESLLDRLLAYLYNADPAVSVYDTQDDGYENHPSGPEVPVDRMATRRRPRRPIRNVLFEVAGIPPAGASTVSPPRYGGWSPPGRLT